MKFITILSLFALCLACGDDDKKTAVASTVSGTCTTSVSEIGKSCLLYAGYSTTLLQTVEKSCAEEAEGVWASAESCPSTELIGTCALPIDGAAPAGISVTDHYYPDYTATSAAATCSASEGTYKSAE